jgi:DNA ligase-1
MNAKEGEWNNWYRRILVKDMKCGVSDTSINKFAPEQYQIPIFTCQLAYDGAKHESKVTGNKMIEVKLDGVRVITIVYPDGKVDQYSRNGKELVNFDHIKKQFAKTAPFLSEPMVYDGEVMSSSFQDLMKQVHRKSNVEANDAVLHLFDMLPLEEFRAGKSTRDQVIRSSLLAGWHSMYAAQVPNIQVVANEFVNLDKPAGRERFAAINKAAIDGGYEGIMIKDPDAVYECDRTVAWLKIKPFIEVTLTVVDVEEGTGKNENNTGALVCEGTDDGVSIRVNVGGGLTDKLRAAIWADIEAVKGQLVEVRADAVTQNQDGSYSLRFPRFLRFRGFVPGEKL